MPPTLSLLLRHEQVLNQGSVLLLGPPVEAVSVFPSAWALCPEWFDFRQWPEGRAEHGWLPSRAGVDQAVVFLPKSRALLECWLQAAAASLRPQGTLWLVGANDEGIRGGAKRLQAQFPAAGKVDAARHCQLWRVAVTEPPAMPEPVSRRETYTVNTAGETLQLAALPGVFSAGRLDEGTALLLASLPVRSLPVGPWLDVGCGCGVIGTWLARQGGSLTLLDSHAAAVDSARETLTLNSLAGEVLASDVFSALGDRRFAAIISNPPFHQGVQTDYDAVRRLIDEAPEHLLPGGELWLVANSFLPYPERLAKRFVSVDTVADNGRFRVYRARVA